MTDTTTLLTTALENEAKLFLKLIDDLQNDDLYEFIRRVAEIKHFTVGSTPADDVIHVAQNVKNIENALENIFTV